MALTYAQKFSFVLPMQKIIEALVRLILKAVFPELLNKAGVEKA